MSLFYLFNTFDHHCTGKELAKLQDFSLIEMFEIKKYIDYKSVLDFQIKILHNSAVLNILKISK